MATLLRKLFGPDLAVDLGTATTRVASAWSRRTFRAPSAVGETRALRGGVVVEPDCAVEVLRPLFAQARRFGLTRPRVVATVPTDADRDERLALEESVRRAGAAAVALAPEPLAAAIGAGLDLGLPYAQLIVDIGHGVTDCVVVRAGAVIESAARRVGCGDLEEAPAPAEQAILGFLESLVREVPHDVGADLVESGIHLTGGGALVPGLAEAVERRTGLSVRRVPEPLSAVVLGGRRLIRTVTEQGAWTERRPRWRSRLVPR